MRHDKHLSPALNLTERQDYFMNCWFNMVHQASVDSYRVRVMNPENVLQELLKMYELQVADDNDRRRVAEEALEIFKGEPILKNGKYAVLEDLTELLNQAIKAKTKESDDVPQDKTKANGFFKHSTLIQSFANELLVALRTNFLMDCFDWLESTLDNDDSSLSDDQKMELYAAIERVCRNLLSIALNDGSSLESLFQHYRGLKKMPDEAEAISEAPSKIHEPPTLPVESYDFMERFRKMRMHLTAPKKGHKLVFVLTDAKPQQFPEKIGNLSFSTTPPAALPASTEKEARYLKRSRFFVTATVEGRDGRAAGMIGYRQIGQILDLVRFEYDRSSVKLRAQFLLEDEDSNRHVLLHIPQIIPNPETELPPQKLEEFVDHLNGLVQREAMLSESKDRIFAAFRLYRVGADADIFENKLVNWWTALEYLAKGSKSNSGSIGGSVEAALAPTLFLAYLPKHLAVYRAMFKDMNGTITTPDGETIDIGTLTNKELYLLFKEQANHIALQELCASRPYLWHHLKPFMDAISTPTKLSELLKGHEQRLRWQIQRIYRARCDVVHSGHLVVNASLLCANLEYYLQVTLNSMLRSFQTVTTLRGPHEFFERTRHMHERITQQLAAKPASDALLIQSLNS